MSGTLLAVAGRLHVWGLNEFGLVFLGIYDGLAIAFLVGRFDSHWMKVPRWMLAPLYGYALIQMIYVFSLQPSRRMADLYLSGRAAVQGVPLPGSDPPVACGKSAPYLEAAEDGKLGPQTAGS
jgi:hypothetical protein